MARALTQWTAQDIIDYFQKLDRKGKLKVALGAGAVPVLFIFILWPAWFSRPQVEGQISSLRSQIQIAEAQIQQEPRLIEEQKEHSDFVERTQSRFLKKDEGEGIVGILAGIADRSQVTLLITEPREEGEGVENQFPAPFDQKYRKISYRVTLEGDYHQLATFVSGVENHPKIFRIEELSITPRAETPRLHLAQVLVSAFSVNEGVTLQLTPPGEEYLSG